MKKKGDSPPWVLLTKVHTSSCEGCLSKKLDVNLIESVDLTSNLYEMSDRETRE